AADTKKITSFFMKNDTQAIDSQSYEPIKIDDLSDSKSEIIDPYTYWINKKLHELKEQLEKHHDQLTIFEYNYKRAIFEYLTLLNNNNR
ncbi:9039_t:CDS:1, partial [Funneliformis caledonium]